jgi:hypothetical protein
MTKRLTLPTEPITLNSSLNCPSGLPLRETMQKRCENTRATRYMTFCAQVGLNFNSRFSSGCRDLLEDALALELGRFAAGSSSSSYSSAAVADRVRFRRLREAVEAAVDGPAPSKSGAPTASHRRSMRICFRPEVDRCLLLSSSLGTGKGQCEH